MTDRAGWLRAGLMLVFLSVAAATIGATVKLPARHVVAHSAPGPVHQHSLPLIVWSAAVIVALVARRVLARRRRAHNREPEVVAAELPVISKGFVTAVLVLFLIVPWLLLWGVRVGLGDALRGHHLGTFPPGASSRHGGGAGRVFGASPSLVTMIVALVVVVLALVAIVAIQTRRRVDDTVPPRPAEPDKGGDVEAKVSLAFGRARRAGLVGATPRARVIAAYQALEQELVRAGLAHQPSETPDELLGRLAVAHPVLAAPCADLTRIFQAARFSTRPLPETDAVTAESALGQLESNLGPAEAVVHE